jgi:hypothetical protein
LAGRDRGSRIVDWQSDREYLKDHLETTVHGNPTLVGKGLHFCRRHAIPYHDVRKCFRVKRVLTGKTDRHDEISFQL